MTRASAIMTWIAVTLFLGAFFFPLWSINLDAPQYPEGMGMKIWISKVTGEKKYDLQNINGLNHYIGMKEIHAESIPELKYMKYIVAFLMLFGAIAAAVRRRRLLIAWVSFSVTVAVIGLVDFYRWAYDYGHNLDPDAPIKVPGMTYQPPLLGSKQLLNITASSYPALGGLLLMIGVGLGVFAVMFEWRRHQGRRRNTSEKKRPARAVRMATTVAMILLIVSCSAQPSPIEFGTDTCDYCRMTIADEQYGAEIVTNKGRVYKYDAVECMVGAIIAGDIDNNKIVMQLVIDHANPTVLTDAADAAYLRSPELRSPMGMNLTSFGTIENARKTRARHPGEILTWEETQALVRAARRQAARR